MEKLTYGLARLTLENGCTLPCDHFYMTDGVNDPYSISFGARHILLEMT